MSAETPSRASIARRSIFIVLLASLIALASSSSAEKPTLPKGYELGDRNESPSGRLAILHPERGSDRATGRFPPNLLVRLHPYAVIAKVREPGLPQGATTELLAEWHGEAFVAVYEFRKWGISDLRVFEIANDAVARVHPVLKEARKLFEKDIRTRLLKRYPQEQANFLFISEEGEENPRRDFAFEGDKLLLDLLADNKPNGAGGPHWTAQLRAVWSLEKPRLEKVDFRPGRISVRPSP